jgi:hypothetical protein
MPEEHAGVTAIDAATALLEVARDGGTAVLLGDRDPDELVSAAASAAGRGFEHVDARGLRTLEFDELVCGRFAGGGWSDGALTRALQSGSVFLLSHGEALLDDLRQRTARLFTTRTVLLHGPRARDDRTVTAAAGCALVLHVDDHQPLLLQAQLMTKQFATRIRADVAGPPPLARR